MSASAQKVVQKRKVERGKFAPGFAVSGELPSVVKTYKIVLMKLLAMINPD
jgi:hypothetical protein